jgi:fucose 4-O-acetylase-like acetyltransferase
MSCGIVLWFIAVMLIRVPVVSDIFRIAGIASIVLYSMHMFIAKLITAPLHTLGTDYWITLDSLGDRLVLLIVTLSVLYLITYGFYWMKKAFGESTDAEYSPASSKL